MRTIIVNGTKPLSELHAIILAASNADRYKVAGDTSWQPAEPAQVPLSVEAVSHFGRHESYVGEVVHVEGVMGEHRGRLRIDGLALVDTGDLADADVAALGYADYDAFIADQPGMRNRRAWLFTVSPAPRRLRIGSWMKAVP